MNYIKSISQLFLVACIVLLVIWLWSNSCNRKSPDHRADAAFNKEQKRLRDSAYNAGMQKDLLSKADSTRWKRAADSAITRLNIANRLLTKNQAYAVELAGKVEQANKDRDTAAYT